MVAFARQSAPVDTMMQRRPASFELQPDTVVDTLGAEAAPASVLPQQVAARPAGEPALPQRQLRLEEFFDGRLWADGVVLDRRGRERRRFHVDMQALWQGDWGRLQESYVFDDGQRQRRTWSLRRLPERQGLRRYEATAGDVVGTARASGSGHSLHWNYLLALPLGERVLRVRMDDRMYLLGDKLLLNHTRMLKFGLHVASLVVTFGKP